MLSYAERSRFPMEKDQSRVMRSFTASGSFWMSQQLCLPGTSIGQWNEGDDKKGRGERPVL